MSWLKKLFLPYCENNHKAHLIRSSSLFLLSFCFVFLQVFLNFFLLAKPAVLGYSANIIPERIIELTNAERAKVGLSSLKENKLLSEAARQKASDMFAFNYWSHVSPSGRSPWAFFTDVGYKYQYAGENLARDFRDPESIVRAWMDSPNHKDNIANPKYQEIGVAVVDGTLQGVETTLVVQLFGTLYGAAVTTKEKTKTVASQNSLSPEEAPQSAFAPKEVLAKGKETQSKTRPLTNPLDLTKATAILMAGVLIGIFLMDVFLISRRETPRLSSHSLAQVCFLIFVLVASLLMRQGAIL